jgi:thioredoxin 1
MKTNRTAFRFSKNMYSLKIKSIIILSLLSLCAFGQIKSYQPKAFQAARQSTPSAILIDLRKPDFYKGAYISKAINISYEQENFEAEIKKLSTQNVLFLYCQNGEKSEQAAIFMSDLGFKNIHVLEGGFENWIRTPLPYINKSNENLAFYSLEDLKSIVNTNQTVLIDFYATWCKPCKEQDAILKELASEHPNLKILKLDAEKNQMLSHHFEIEEIPTLILFKNKKQVWRRSGLSKKKVLTALL